MKQAFKYQDYDTSHTGRVSDDVVPNFAPLRYARNYITHNPSDLNQHITMDGSIALTRITGALQRLRGMELLSGGRRVM